MCGIIGYLGPKEVVPILLDGLRRLEYRGYDSAGVAVVRNGQIERRRSAGKLVNLERAIETQPLQGIYGVGHTRWATHGRPTEENAHPHQDCSGKIVVVHNGIIENYLDLKQQLQKLGHAFVTETDSEVIAHLLEHESKKDGLEGAARRALLQMRGLFAFVAISTDDPEKIIAVRNGPPIVVGLGDNEFFVASDTPAILSHTRDVVFLGDEEMAVVTRRGVEFTNFAGTPVSKATQRVLWDPIMAEKSGYRHFMLKEIFEQPRAAEETLLGRVSLESGHVFLEEIAITEEDLARDHQGRPDCVRDIVARSTGRQVPHRTIRQPAGRSRLRFRIPLSRLHRGRAHAGCDHYAVRRDGGHARGAPRSTKERGAQSRHLQRGRQHGHARSRRHGLHARRPRNWRRLHQSVYVAACRPESAGAVSRSGQKHAG